MALTWGAVDLDEAVARVRLTRTGGHTHSPKNHEKRDVDLTADAMELLRDWRAELGNPVGDVLVFPGAGAGGYLDPTTVTSRELYGAMERAGIDRLGPKGELRTFHSLRHTFAKRALERGAQIAWLSRHLGHSSIVVTIGSTATGSGPSAGARSSCWTGRSRSTRGRAGRKPYYQRTREPFWQLSTSTK